jgi:hypothetical protein
VAPEPPDVELAVAEIVGFRRSGEPTLALRTCARLRRAGQSAGPWLVVPVDELDNDDPIPAILAFAGIRLVEVRLVRTGIGSWAATLQLEAERPRAGIAGGFAEPEAQAFRASIAALPGRAIALAQATGCQLRIARADWDAEATDPQERRDARAELSAHRRDLADRLGGRREPLGPVLAQPPLHWTKQEAVEAALDQLRTSVDAGLALLLHDRSGLVAHAGPADVRLLRRYGRAYAAEDAPLADLLRLDVFDPDGGYVLFSHLGSGWGLELGPVAAGAHRDREALVRDGEERLRDALSSARAPS